VAHQLIGMVGGPSHFNAQRENRCGKWRWPLDIKKKKNYVILQIHGDEDFLKHDLLQWRHEKLDL